MTKMAARAINSKIFKNRLLQNQNAYDFKTRHEASGNEVYINHDTGMTWNFLRQGQLMSPMHLSGKKKENLI